MDHARLALRLPLLLLAALLIAALTVGCGSHAPTLPSPNGGGGDGDLIEVVDFIVPEREVRQFDYDTTVHATGIVLIEGAVVGADGSSPGEDGCSLDIQADGEVTVTGTVKAGDGASGGPDEPGGHGGSVRLASVNANVTIGPGNVFSGNGGDGGDGSTGGRGGDGGLIALDCPDGTLTINQSPGLLHVGNGGKGGQGVVGGEDLLTIDPPERLPNGGGNSGGIGGACAELVGVHTQPTGLTGEGEPELVAVLEEGVGTGGAGGAAGDYFYGADPLTGESTWPAQAAVARESSAAKQQEPEVIEGARGGDGVRTAGPGASVNVDRSGHRAPEGQSGRALEVWGGRGGDASYGSSLLGWFLALGDEVVVSCVTSFHLTAGNGGDATATGYPGGTGAACGPGGMGGAVVCHGGPGGGLYDLGFDMEYLHLGRGGDAMAVGGRGGSSGPCCDPPRRGITGGGGGGAHAMGGKGGVMRRSGAEVVGPGGSARAVGGPGGRGGDGAPPGVGGGGAGQVIATPGQGDPAGEDLGETPSPRGPDGDRCPDDTGIGGRLTTANGSPIAGHFVGLLQDNQLVAEVQSGADGRYLFPSVPPGSYTVQAADPAPGTVWDPGRRDVTKYEDVPINGQNFVLRDTSPDDAGPNDIGGWLETYEGEPVAGHWVGLFQNGTLVAEVQSNPRGRFVFQNVPPGDYRIVPANPNPGYSWDPPERQVRKLAGTAIRNQSFILGSTSYTVTVPAVCPFGEPLVGIAIRLEHGNGQVWRANTGQNGAAVFTGIPPGNVRIAVESAPPAGYRWEITEFTIEGLSTDITTQPFRQVAT